MYVCIYKILICDFQATGSNANAVYDPTFSTLEVCLENISNDIFLSQIISFL